MMKQICTAFLLGFVGFSGVAQESSAPSVAIPLIASDSHHRPTSVTVESLVITDQKTPTRGSDDRVFILQFAATPQATDWLNKEQLQSAPVTIRIGGGTALYDALAMACKERMGPRDWRKPARRIMVLISDGEDNQSHITRDEAASEALRVGAVIFTIDTDLSGMSYRGVKIMQTLAEVTGSESFSQIGRKDAPKVFASIKEMMDGMYYLRYVPPDASKSAVHEVEVKRGPKEKFKLSYARRYLWNQ